MSQRRLRPLPRISYQEIEEPNFDEYVYCEMCGDYVYEYCSIHGPLLVIPDEKVSQMSTIPMKFPRASLTIPNVFLHLNHSTIPGAGLGVFATLTLPSGVRFGPYCGKRTYQIESSYCWQIYDGNKKPLHVIDGSDSTHSNWMRYVNCARNYQEQNIVAFQYQGDIYYRTIKIIPRSTELLLFYGREFADTLQIDLSKYNCKVDHLGTAGTNLPTLNYFHKATADIEADMQAPLLEKVTSTTLEIARTNALKPTPEENKNYEIQDDFEYIDNLYVTEDVRQPMFENDEHKVVFNPEKQCFEIEFQNHVFDVTEANENDSQVDHNFKAMSDKMVQVDFNSEVTLHNNVPVVSSSCRKENLNEFSDFNMEYNMFVKVEQNLGDNKKIFTKIVKGNVTTWQCNECHKILASWKSLTRHARIHIVVKQLKCSECEFTTNHKIHLDEHRVLHLGNVSQKCDLCPFTTHSKKNLSRHIRRIHYKTIENQQSCQFCGYKINTKTGMEHHMALHGNNDAFKCDLCGYLTTMSRSLKRHILKVHNKPQK